MQKKRPPKKKESRATSFPKVKSTSETARLAVTILQQKIENAHWLFRRQDGDTDFGVDAEIEIVSDNRVTGRLFKSQIKGSKSASDSSVTVKTTTYHLWQAIPLPTILFLVDVSAEQVFWTPALAHHPKPGAASLTVKFEPESEFDSGGFTRLRTYLQSWFSTSGGDAILQDVPYYHDIFKALHDEVDQNDDWCALGPEEEGRFQCLYRHILRLRLHLGFDDSGVPSIGDWYARDAGIWEMFPEFSWAGFSEAMKVITPLYEAALNRLDDRLREAPANFTNQHLRRFVAKRTGNLVASVTYYQDKRSADLTFHERMEAILSSANGLKHKFKSTKTKR